MKNRGYAANYRNMRQTEKEKLEVSLKQVQHNNETIKQLLTEEKRKNQEKDREIARFQTKWKEKE